MPTPAAVAGASLRPCPADPPSPASPPHPASLMSSASPPSPASAPSPADRLRVALLARVRTAAASAWASQDAELADEIAALEAAGECAVPTEDELDGLAPDPLSDPPDGEHGWLADLPGPLLDEYLAASVEPVRPEPLPAGLWSRPAGDG